MKKLLILLLLGLSACSGNQKIFLTKEKPIVIMPAKEMFVCAENQRIPNPETLTDIKVAQYIIELKTDVEICQNKLKSIETFLEKAKERLESE